MVQIYMAVVDDSIIMTNILLRAITPENEFLQQ